MRDKSLLENLHCLLWPILSFSHVRIKSLVFHFSDVSHQILITSAKNITCNSLVFYVLEICKITWFSENARPHFTSFRMPRSL